MAGVSVGEAGWASAGIAEPDPGEPGSVAVGDGDGPGVRGVLQ